MANSTINNVILAIKIPPGVVIDAAICPRLETYAQLYAYQYGISTPRLPTVPPHVVAFISFSILANSRSNDRVPPLYAFRETAALPSADLGPVDLSQGCHCRISADCRARRSGVQPLPMLLLQ